MLVEEADVTPLGGFRLQNNTGKFSMKDMYLLREYHALCPGGVCQDLLTEAEKREVNDKKSYYLTGIIQRADDVNGNGRIYPYELLKEQEEEYQKLIQANRAIGELDHPEYIEVKASEASHMITEMWWEGKTLMGKLKVLSTPKGQVLRSLIDDGVQLGISSRGLGSISKKGGNIYVDEFKLMCFDVVHEPSTMDAFLHPIKVSGNMKEAINYTYCSLKNENKSLYQLIKEVGNDQRRT